MRMSHLMADTPEEMEEFPQPTHIRRRTDRDRNTIAKDLPPSGSVASPTADCLTRNNSGPTE
jgi:hypothetical protein